MSERYKGYLQRIFIIAIPIILSNIISELQMMIDRIFLGRMDDLYMSAIGNATGPIWTTMSFCFAVVTGSSILISQAVGAGKKEDIEKYAGAMLKWNNVIPVCMFLFWLVGAEGFFKLMGVSDALMPHCLAYTRWYSPIFITTGLGASLSVILQTSSNTKPLVWYGLIRSLTNVVLDWVMIFGHLGCPKLGITGAAMATTIAEYAGGVFILIVIIRSNNLKTKPSWSSIVRAKIGPFIQGFRLGVNAALEDFSWNLGNLAIIRILNSIDDKAAGIYTVIFGIEVLAVVFIMGLASGTLTLSGEATGEGDRDAYKGVGQISYSISAFIAFLLLIVCLIIPEPIVGLFTKDMTVIVSSQLYLFMMSVNLFSKAANIIIGNGIRGYGDTKWMFYTQIFGTVFIVSLAALMVYGLGLGIIGVFLAVLMDEFVRAIINLMRYIYIIVHWDRKQEIQA